MLLVARGKEDRPYSRVGEDRLQIGRDAQGLRLAGHNQGGSSAGRNHMGHDGPRGLREESGDERTGGKVPRSNQRHLLSRGGGAGGLQGNILREKTIGVRVGKQETQGPLTTQSPVSLGGLLEGLSFGD